MFIFRHQQGLVLENGTSIAASALPLNGHVTSTTSLSTAPLNGNYFNLNLNHRTPMTMTDEEFANNFIPHTPPGVACLPAMQVRKTNESRF